ELTDLIARLQDRITDLERRDSDGADHSATKRTVSRGTTAGFSRATLLRAAVIGAAGAAGGVVLSNRPAVADAANRSVRRHSLTNSDYFATGVNIDEVDIGFNNTGYQSWTDGASNVHVISTYMGGGYFEGANYGVWATLTEGWSDEGFV